MLARSLIPLNRNRSALGRDGRTGYPLGILHRDMDRMFDDVLRGFGVPAAFDRSAANGAAIPKMDVVDGEHDVRITAELPGLDEKDIEVTLANGVLTIRGERKTDSEDKAKDDRYHLRERSFGAFERSMRIDVPVKEDSIKATFANGLLSVVLPKTDDAKSKVRQIPITH